MTTAPTLESVLKAIDERGPRHLGLNAGLLAHRKSSIKNEAEGLDVSAAQAFYYHLNTQIESNEVNIPRALGRIWRRVGGGICWRWVDCCRVCAAGPQVCHKPEGHHIHCEKHHTPIHKPFVYRCWCGSIYFATSVEEVGREYMVGLWSATTKSRSSAREIASDCERAIVLFIEPFNEIEMVRLQSAMTSAPAVFPAADSTSTAVCCTVAAGKTAQEMIIPPPRNSRSPMVLLPPQG